jgi:hypothetical protein
LNLYIETEEFEIFENNGIVFSCFVDGMGWLWFGRCVIENREQQKTNANRWFCSSCSSVLPRPASGADAGILLFIQCSH